MNNDTFQWTNELLVEWGEYYINHKGRVNIMESPLEAFIQSKTPKKEWEISSYMPPSSHPIPATNTLVALYDFPIHSVRRLSDNEVFTVGDTTTDGEIQKFEILSPSVLAADCLKCERKMLVQIINLEKQPKKKRIEVELTSGNNGKDSTIITIQSKIRMPVAKFPAIKAAIERVLNDEQMVSKDYLERVCAEKNIEYAMLKEKLKEAEEKAFNAGREWTQPLTFNYGGTSPRVLPEIKQKFATFQDYLNSKK